MFAETVLVIAHAIGAALGVGGATVSDFLFLRAVKDGRIDRKELSFIHGASHIVWVGLTAAILSGVGLVYLGLGSEPKVLAKFTIVVIILVNGIILHKKIFPILKSHAGQRLTSKAFTKNLPLAMSVAAISIVSWYTTLILGSWRGLDASFTTIIGGYLLVLITAILISNLVGKWFMKLLKKS